MKRMSKSEKAAAVAEAKTYMQECIDCMHPRSGHQKPTFYANITRATKSGSTFIKFYVISKDGDLLNVSHHCARITGQTLTADGVRVPYVNMDPAFYPLDWVVRELGIKDWQKKFHTHNM